MFDHVFDVATTGEVLPGQVGTVAYEGICTPYALSSPEAGPRDGSRQMGVSLKHCAVPGRRG